MSDTKAIALQALRAMLRQIETGAEISSANVKRDAHGFYQVEIVLARLAKYEAASFNGIEFPGLAPIGVYQGDGHPAARAKYEPEPEGAEET